MRRRQPIFDDTLESRAIALELANEFPHAFADVHEIVKQSGGIREVAKATLVTGLSPKIILNALGIE